MPRSLTFFASSLLCALPAFSQTGTAPVLATPAEAPYPINARTAHVGGEAVVAFSIDATGKTAAVHAVSGPEVLTRALADEIRGWRFTTPLPRDAEKDFVADYTFTIVDPQEQLEDDVNEPTPGGHISGGSVVLPPSIAAVSGTVHSVSNRQAIDATPSSPPGANICRNEGSTKAPAGSDPSDFVELTRAGFSDSDITYRVRVSRGGKVEWRGVKGVKQMGEAGTTLPAADAEEVMKDGAPDDLWATCSVKLPAFGQPLKIGDVPTGNYVTARIGGQERTIEIASYAAGADEGEKLAWYLDHAADTFQWRHGDAAAEPLSNMEEDIELPKPGVTALMRAVLRFHPKTGVQSFEPLKYLLSKSADVNEADESGWTALMYAAALNPGNNEAVQLLLAAHADARHASPHGDTALMAAALRGVLNGTLVKAGADVNARNADGVTALMLLAETATPAVLKQAIAAGANPAARDKAGRSAADYLRACKTPIVPLPRHVGGTAQPSAACIAGTGESEALLKR